MTIAAETHSFPAAFGQLGIMHQENENYLPKAERSNKKTYDFYTRGIELDDPLSMFNLGMLHVQGSCGVELSFEKARTLWIAATDDRHIGSASYAQAVSSLEKLEYDMKLRK